MMEDCNWTSQRYNSGKDKNGLAANDSLCVSVTGTRYTRTRSCANRPYGQLYRSRTRKQKHCRAFVFHQLFTIIFITHRKAHRRGRLGPRSADLLRHALGVGHDVALHVCEGAHDHHAQGAHSACTAANNANKQAPKRAHALVPFQTKTRNSRQNPCPVVPFQSTTQSCRQNARTRYE